MSRALRGVVVVLLVGAVLAACATAPRPVPEEAQAAWAGLRARLDRLERWRADGRLVFRADGDASHARFTWVEEGDGAFRLRLAGPWGQGKGRLESDGRTVVLVTEEGRAYRGDEPGRLLAAVYGWEVPVSGLRHWLIGLPGTGADYTLDRFGRLGALDWRGWHIDYGGYTRVGEVELPAVLTARNPSRDTEVRVAVDDWRLGGGGAPAPHSPVPLIGGS